MPITFTTQDPSFQALHAKLDAIQAKLDAKPKKRSLFRRLTKKEPS